MGFVKLDCKMLDSTTWYDKPARDIFITALLMAEPHEVEADMPQIAVNSLDYTGWVVPAGWYGFVRAASTGLIRRAMVEIHEGMEALTRLGDPDLESRSNDHEGRRLVRVDGGFVVLNFMKHRERDTTSAERSRRWRERRMGTPSHRDATASPRDAQRETVSGTPLGTQAEERREKREAENQTSFVDSVGKASSKHDVLVGHVLACMRDAMQELTPSAKGPRDTLQNRKLILAPVKACGATADDWRAVIRRQLESVRPRREAWKYLSLSTLGRPQNFQRELDREDDAANGPADWSGVL